MTDKCPHCGAANPEKLPFCNACGEPIEKDLQLIMDIQHITQAHAKKKRDYDDFFDDDEDEVEEHKHPLLFVSLFIAIAAIAWFFLR